VLRLHATINKESRPHHRPEPTITIPLLTILLALAAAPAPSLLPLPAPVGYRVTGSDLYEIGTSITKHIAYAGTEILSIRRERDGERFSAVVTYLRADGAHRAQATARFEQVLAPDGTAHDILDEDPDFLTVLNQPFAVRIDAGTIAALETVTKRIPFDAPSPLGQGLLEGYLQPSERTIVHGVPALAVRFSADGAMDGPLPDHPSLRVVGGLHLDGRADYALDDGRLLDLDARLTLTGGIRTDSGETPVRIVYLRTLRTSAAPTTQARRPAR